METIWQDFRFSLRMLLRRPAFAALALLTLALGIGANTAIFSVIYSVILRPLPYPGADALVLIHGVNRDGRTTTLSPLDFHDFVEQSNAFQSATAIEPETYNLTGKGEPERVAGASVSSTFFEVFGVPPALGRGFQPAEEKLGSASVAVISYDLWQRRFSGDSNVLGKTIELDGSSYTIVGVGASGFQFPAEVDVWRPLQLTADAVDAGQRGARYLRCIGRLKKGVSFQQARRRIEDLGRDMARKFPNSNEGWTASVTGLQDYIIRKVRQALWVLLGAVGFVLLIAIVNVANLFLVHAAHRQSEVAIRTALGAGRGRLVRQFLVEGLLITTVAGILGCLGAFWLTDLVRLSGPANLPRLQEIAISTPVLLFTFAISMFAGVLVALVPAIQSARQWRDSLHDASQRTMRSGTRARALLVAGEIAMALMLLAGAGLLIRSFERLKNVDPGFQTEGVYTFALSLPQARYPELHHSSAFYSALTQRLARQPGIQASAAVFGLPLTHGFSAGGSFERSDKPDASQEPEAGLRVITPDYFQVMGIALHSGRPFKATDDSAAPGVAIINEEAASRYWPGENPVGKQLRMHISLIGEKSAPRTIVAVVKNVRYESFDADVEPEIFIPHAQHPVNEMTVVVRANPSLQGMSAMIRGEVRAMDPQLPVWAYQTMDELVGASMSERRFTMMLLASFAGLALLLAAVGIYGVLSYTVAQRTREIGLRMAIGARRSDVIGMFFKEGTRVLLLGLSAGLVGGFAVTRLLASLLFGVHPSDPVTFIFVACLLSGIAIFAGCLPALRASRIDPMSALRYE